MAFWGVKNTPQKKSYKCLQIHTSPQPSVVYIQELASYPSRMGTRLIQELASYPSHMGTRLIQEFELCNWAWSFGVKMQLLCKHGYVLERVATYPQVKEKTAAVKTTKLCWFVVRLFFSLIKQMVALQHFHLWNPPTNMIIHPTVPKLCVIGKKKKIFFSMYTQGCVLAHKNGG